MRALVNESHRSKDWKDRNMKVGLVNMIFLDKMICSTMFALEIQANLVVAVNSTCAKRMKVRTQ